MPVTDSEPLRTGPRFVGQGRKVVVDFRVYAVLIDKGSADILRLSRRSRRVEAVATADPWRRGFTPGLAARNQEHGRS